MAKVKNPLSRVFQWAWGPEDGVGIIKTGEFYVLINVPEPDNATEEYLYQYGFPMGKHVDTIDYATNISKLVNVANQRQEADRPNHPEIIGDKATRIEAEKMGLNKYQAALAKFWSVVTKKSSLPPLDDPSDLLDEFTDDITFQQAVDEIVRDSGDFIWQFLTEMPLSAKNQALWRIAVINSPSKPGDFGLDSRSALVVKMYKASGGHVGQDMIKDITSEYITIETIIDIMSEDNDKFLRVVNRLMKTMGFHKAMMYLLSDVQRIRLVRKYIRDLGNKWIDSPYF